MSDEDKKLLCQMLQELLLEYGMTKRDLCAFFGVPRWQLDFMLADKVKFYIKHSTFSRIRQLYTRLNTYAFYQDGEQE